MKRKPPPRKPPAADASGLLAQAVACHNRGELREAERIYRAVLTKDPGHFDALHLLGTVRAQSGAAEDGAALILRALSIKPDVPEAHNNLGFALKALGRATEAVECYRKAVRLKPGYVDAHKNLGEALIALKRGEDAIDSLRVVAAARPGAAAYCNLGYAYRMAGRFDEALSSYRQALAADPGSARVHSGLGNALLEAGRAADALEAYDRALGLQPDYAEAHNNRGNALISLERREEAVAAYRAALAIKPGYGEAHYNLANALRSVEQPAEAMSRYQEALAINPRHIEAWNNLGALLLDLNRAEDANAVFERALAVEPDSAEVHTNRGNALLALRRTEDAVAAHRRAAELKPGLAEAHNNLANTLRIAGRHEEAVASYEAALALDPGQTYALGKVAGSLAYLCEWARLPGLVQRIVESVRRGERAANPFVFFGLSGDAADQLACARTYVMDRRPPAAAALWRGERYRHERIRVAYLSADFREHAVSWLIAGLIEGHDRAKFEVWGVSFGPDGASPMRDRLKAGFEHYVDVRTRSDAEVAALLREWEIDIAIDLMGHTLDSRSGIFARRPAPAQVSYLGFPATTGADYMDYILADRFLIPERSRTHYSEHVVYLPDTFQVNDTRRKIADRTPTRAEAGLPERGFVYCCFNGTHKVTPAFFDAWMRLLSRVEGSVLWLIARDDATAANLRREARSRGVAPERLIFAPRTEHEHYLARYRIADLFLDTLPFNAGTTASDALWAGLPVLTCAGEAFASRMAGSLLHAVGLPELVTHSLEDYEARAVELAAQPDRLSALRQKLAANRSTAPLFDTDRFRRHVEAAYRTMWEIAQRGESPRSFSVGAEDSGSSLSSTTGTR